MSQPYGEKKTAIVSGRRMAHVDEGSGSAIHRAHRRRHRILASATHRRLNTRLNSQLGGVANVTAPGMLSSSAIGIEE
jgi:hypothetical protein